MSAASGGGATPKPASTVVLARDAACGGIEVFLVQRHASMGFMGGMHVFPGGKLNTGDATQRTHARFADLERGPAQHDVWGAEIGPDEALARVVAAVRETFEEAGVLLCARGAHLDAPSSAALRASLHAGADFGALLEQSGVRLELALLQPLSRWITPEGERTRFDTSFYVARMPDGQYAEHDQYESVAGEWLDPQRALDAAREGRIRLSPPTALTLESLQAAASVDAALALAAARRPPTVLPILRVLETEVVILYPGDPEHPVATPAFDGPTRRVLRRA